MGRARQRIRATAVAGGFDKLLGARRGRSHDDPDAAATSFMEQVAFLHSSMNKLDVEPQAYPQALVAAVQLLSATPPLLGEHAAAQQELVNETSYGLCRLAKQQYESMTLEACACTNMPGWLTVKDVHRELRTQTTAALQDRKALDGTFGRNPIEVTQERYRAEIAGQLGTGLYRDNDEALISLFGTMQYQRLRDQTQGWLRRRKPAGYISQEDWQEILDVWLQRHDETDTQQALAALVRERILANYEKA